MTIVEGAAYLTPRVATASELPTISRSLLTLFAVLAVLGAPAPVAAGSPIAAPLTITAIAPPQAGDAPWMIYLDGQFDAEAPGRLAGLIVQERITRADVYFNSPGGSLLGAMAVGRLLRGRGFDSHVGRRSVDPRQAGAAVCYSACPFGFAGGVRRFLGADSVLGVHEAANRAPLEDDSTFQRLVAAQATRYLDEMGVSVTLLGLMHSVPRDRIRVLTPDEAVALGLVNAVAASAEAVGAEAARGSAASDRVDTAR